VRAISFRFGKAEHRLKAEHVSIVQDPIARSILAVLTFAQWHCAQLLTPAPGYAMKKGYDYVVVGSGSAGCVLAARLSEDPTAQVALIEAGAPDDAPEIHTPIAFAQLFKSDHDWDYSSDPEPALGGRRIYLPRGKVLGGCSSMNAMIYMRGNRADYDEWAAAGASGWSYDELLPYFIKAENNERGVSRFHGVDGPLFVQEGRSQHPLIDSIINAFVQTGHPRNDDFNGASQLGAGRFQVTQHNGMRCSAATAYLRPARARKNLDVITKATVARVVLENSRATGVEVHCHGEKSFVRAEREVILSAGTYNSPQILMLSGVGKSDDLKAVGLDTRVELPVGDGLQDHPGVLLSYFTDSATLFRAGTTEDVRNFQESGRGPLSSNVSEGGGFFRTDPSMELPDVFFNCGPVMFYEEALSPPFDDAFVFGPYIVKPTSRGSVKLRSARPDVKPRIFNNYLSTEEDRRSLIRGVQLAMDVAQRPAITAVSRGPHLVPTSSSDVDVWSFIQRHAQTFYHPVSTCGIGRVVDPLLRVFGVDRLRVVDASVMPTIVRANTNAPVIAIAERAADLIRRSGPACE
jgi:choline dehydrogenase-like flavoprotein